MGWKVILKSSVEEDLCWFGRKTSRLLLKKTMESLSIDPLLESRNQKTLRPNAFAQRELRLLGKYRILFDVDENTREVLVILAGEKIGASLFVRGEEFTDHEDDTAE